MDTLSSYYYTINTNVQSSLNFKIIKTRPNASSGAWLSLLLPVAVSTGAFKFPDSSTHYQRIGIFSIGLLASAFICIMKTMTRMSKQCYGAFLVASVITTALLLFRLSNNSQVLLSLFGGLFSVYSYTYGIMNLLMACPHCLTYGEAAILTQAIILFIFSTLTNLSDSWYHTPHQCMEIATLILQVGLFGIGLICVLSYYIPKLRSTIYFYGHGIAILVCGVVPVLHILLQRSPVLWILELLFTDGPRAAIVLYWALCSAVATKAVTMQIQHQEKASTVVRKYFHLLAVAVFIPGLIREGCLLYLASGIILALFIALEMLRILCVPPLGKTLQDGFSVFADEKDQGALALTPIYLMAGCSLPLWLHPSATPDSACLLPLLSGILSIGIGDTAASVCGTWFGRHRWPGGTTKTIEGTLACIFSQLAVVLVLTHLGVLEGSTSLLIRAVIAIIITSIAEAKTDQVDNLVLPLVMYILLI